MPEDSQCAQLQIPVNSLTHEIRRYLYLSDNSTNIIKFMSDKTNDPSSSPESESTFQSDNVECLNRNVHFQDGRAPSPASISSHTSGRRLEWDSGADVGYQPSTTIHPSSLSTLERMALGGCAESLIRTDPEGTNSCVGSGVNPIHKSIIMSVPSTYSESQVVNTIKTVTSPREISGVINLSIFANNEAVSVKSADNDENDSVTNSRNISLSIAGDNSLPENISVSDASGNESFHNSDGVGQINTHVNENITSEGDNVLTPLAGAVHTNSASSSSLASTIVPHKPSESLPLQMKKTKTHGKRITRGTQVGGSLVKCNAGNFNGGAVLSSRNHSTDEDERKELRIDSVLSVMNKNCKFPKKTGLDSIDTSSFDRANSFEYFPGEMCGASVARKETVNEVKFNTSKNRRTNNSLSKDLEENIGRMREILGQNKVSKEERQILIKQLVERIVGSEYCDDFEEKNSSKNSTEPCRREENAFATRAENFSKLNIKSSKPMENEETLSHKSYVPYCPIPGGRMYHVAMGTKLEQGYKSSTSYCESDESRPVTCYLPMDRVRITQHSSSSSEMQGISSALPGKQDRVYKPHMKTAEYACKWNQKQTHVNSSEIKGHHSMEERHGSYIHKGYLKGRPSTKPNWWSPATKSEKKRISETAKDKSNPLLTYVERERANQLHWIKNEINHLSSLAQLLEDCAVIKADSPTSFEEQMSILSSLRQHNKASKNVDNVVDKFLSSARSSPLEDPITATMNWPRGSSRRKVVGSTSPLLQHGSNQSPTVEQSTSQSTPGSHSLPSRSSSRNLTNSDISYKHKVLGHKHTSKKSEAYVLTFEAVSPEKNFEGQNRMASRKPLKEVRLRIPARKGRNNIKVTNECHVWTSLQEQLEVHHPGFIKTSEERQKCLEELARLRSLRQMTRRKLLQFTMNAWEDPLNIKHPHDEEKNVMPKPKSVHAASTGRYSGKSKENGQLHCTRLKRKNRPLPEIQSKEAERIKKQTYQTNRIMANIFSRRLQRKVLSGAVSLSNSASVISSL